MTAEAKKWIVELLTDSRQVIYECSEGPEGTKVVLDQERLTDEEIDKALDFSKNGSPGITLEYRSWEYQESLNR